MHPIARWQLALVKWLILIRAVISTIHEAFSLWLQEGHYNFIFEGGRGRGWYQPHFGKDYVTWPPLAQGVLKELAFSHLTAFTLMPQRHIGF